MEQLQSLYPMIPDPPPLDTAVVFFVFNRPAKTQAVFERIAQARPLRLLLIADGPRSTEARDSGLCEEVRRIATQVDWPCELQTNFARTNMGCRQRLISGLNWAFEQVEEAIILEDDILPDPSLFRFLQEMLTRFRGDSNIAMISGFNAVEAYLDTPYSFYFSQLTHIWGWAAWRRSWARYDEHLKDWPAIRASGILREILPDAKHRLFWTRVFDQMHSGTGPDTWDYQFAYTNFIHNSLAVVPRVNMVENIGFGPDATHTTGRQNGAVQAKALAFPLLHPPAMIPLRHLDAIDCELSGFHIRSPVGRALGKLRQIASLGAAR